jgi:hypothetical protein
VVVLLHLSFVLHWPFSVSTSDRLKESTDARTEERTAWEIDKMNLLQKITDTKMDVAEMKRRREKNAKANEEVV